jgi:hypothetical protein
MPIDERRRSAIATVVATYDRAAEGPQPRNATRLLAVMFPDNDVCRCSLEALEEDGFTRGVLRKTLRRLDAAGVLLRERGAPTLIGSTCSWGGHEDRPPLIPSEGHSASASEVARAVCRILTLVISTPIRLPEAPNSPQTPGATSWCRARMASAGPN